MGGGGGGLEDYIVSRAFNRGYVWPDEVLQRKLELQRMQRFLNVHKKCWF